MTSMITALLKFFTDNAFGRYVGEKTKSAALILVALILGLAGYAYYVHATTQLEKANVELKAQTKELATDVGLLAGRVQEQSKTAERAVESVKISDAIQKQVTAKNTSISEKAKTSISKITDRSIAPSTQPDSYPTPEQQAAEDERTHVVLIDELWLGYCESLKPNDSACKAV